MILEKMEVFTILFPSDDFLVVFCCLPGAGADWIIYLEYIIWWMCQLLFEYSFESAGISANVAGIYKWFLDSLEEPADGW